MIRTSVQSRLAEGHIAAAHPPLQSSRFTLPCLGTPGSGECSRPPQALYTCTTCNSLIRGTLQPAGTCLPLKSSPSLRESGLNPHLIQGACSAGDAANCKQVLPKVIWEERVALAQLRNKVPIGYNGTLQIHQKTAPSLRRSPPLSNTLITRSTPLTTLNGIRIQSAVLPQYTPDGPTDRQTD